MIITNNEIVVGNAELWIHQGTTSSGEKLEILKYPPPNQEKIKENEHILLISKGFYVRFKGLVHAESKLGLAYTAFSNSGLFNVLMQNISFLIILL